MNKKRGNVLFIMVFVGIVLIILTLMQVYILYMQINSFVYPIKQNIFYIDLNLPFLRTLSKCKKANPTNLFHGKTQIKSVFPESYLAFFSGNSL